MYDGKSISVVLGTYREKKSIKKTLDDFYKTGFVDEIIVVNNNAESGTNEEIKSSLAFNRKLTKIVYETNQGYGFAYRRALIEAKSDIVIATEADGTFLASDLERFLVYAKDFDMVLGTRTSQVAPFQDAGMGIVRKFANVFEAKSIEILFGSVALTDVGCTYKLFKKPALKKISKIWSNDGSALFNTEITLLAVTSKIKFVEIPITYNKRVGKSEIVGTLYKTIKWAIVIQIYIFYFWLKTKVSNPPSTNL